MSLFGNVLICVSLLEDSLVGYRILGDFFFSFSTLNISHCFLAFKVFYNVFVIVYAEFLFSCCFQNWFLAFHCLNLIWLSWISMSLYLWFSWNSGSFLLFYIQIFSLPIVVSLLPLRCQQCICWSIWWCPTGLLQSVHFLQ